MISFRVKIFDYINFFPVSGGFTFLMKTIFLMKLSILPKSYFLLEKTLLWKILTSCNQKHIGLPSLPTDCIHSAHSDCLVRPFLYFH